MKASAEQDRAEFEAWWRGYTKSTKAPRFEGGAYIFPAANTAWNTWQAARRAPAVPVPQGWKLVPDANNMTDEQAEAICNLVSCCGGGAHEVYEAALAAAPQPPEAPLVPSIAVTPEMVEAANEAYCPFGDMELALCAALQVAPIPPEAAPVELPGPVAFALEWTFDGEERGIRLYDDERHCRFDAESDGGVCHPLYTEQQVRQLLAAHSIKEQST